MNRKKNYEEIILDTELIFNGDARILFTLQKVSAEIRNIRLKATARITLKPLLSTFPIFGGFQLTFIQKPSLDYNLGGVGSLAEIPGINNIVKSIVDSQIKSRFVWPNRFSFYFPLDKISPSHSMNNDENYANFHLIKPAGLLVVNVVEAKNLVAKDKGFTGSGKSDPYAIISYADKKVSFQSNYVEKNLNPLWNYSTEFIVENIENHDLKVDVFDYDHGSQDDFMGNLILPIRKICGEDNLKEFSSWISLQGVKHGEILLKCFFKPVVPDFDEEDNSILNYDNNDPKILSLFIDDFANILNKKGSTPSNPKLLIKLGNRDVDSIMINTNKKAGDNATTNYAKLYHVKNPEIDELMIEIIDSKSNKYLGKITLSMKYLMQSKNQQLNNKEMPIEGIDSDTYGALSLSAKLFAIK